MGEGARKGYGMTRATYEGFGPRASVPQSEQATSNQVPNQAGGYVFQVDAWTRLRRFLILGTEGGTYYQGEREITKECYDTVVRCLKLDGQQTVKEIVDADSHAPKKPPILFALAVAMSAKEKGTRKAAAYVVPIICKIPTHLWMLLNYLKDHRGHGVLVRKAVESWLREYDTDRLAYHMIKYRGREGWTWRDLLREFKPVPRTTEESRLYKWATGKVAYLDKETKELPKQVLGFEVLQRTSDPPLAAAMIKDARLPREAVPTELLNSREVWSALLVDMPYTAMVRNLGKIGSLGMLKPFGDTAKLVTDRILDPIRIAKSKVHPIQLLSASLVYGSGQGVRGSLSWEVNADIVRALEKAFYIAFDNVQGTGKNLVIGLDVSSSMTWGTIAGIPGLTPVVGEAAMSLLHAKVEPTSPLYLAFTKDIKTVPIHGDMSLDGAIRACQDRQFGGTDCSAPMNYCIDQGIGGVDAFIVYTDNQAWAGRRNHPFQALEEYRRKFDKPDAKLLVVAFTADGGSIANPEDGGMLDVVGFDTAAPGLMDRFIRGEV